METRRSHGPTRPDYLRRPHPTLLSCHLSSGLRAGLSLPFLSPAAATPFSTTRGRCFLPPSPNSPTPRAALPVFTCRGKQRAWSSQEQLLPATGLWRSYQPLITRPRKQHIPGNQSTVTTISLGRNGKQNTRTGLLKCEKPIINSPGLSA